MTVYAKHTGGGAGNSFYPVPLFYQFDANEMPVIPIDWN